MTELDPFTHHAYLACCIFDLPPIIKLQRRLETAGVSCLPRCDSSDANASIQSSIVTGVNNCQKLVLYFTENYINDDWYNFETTKVLAKANRFSRDSVIVLRDESLTSLPELVNGFTQFNVAERELDEDSFVQRVVNEIYRKPNPTLVSMPKENIGYGSALGYYYGFLRLVLPDFRKRLLNETLANNAEMAKCTMKKMLIIMPESCFCPPAFEVPGLIEHTNKFVNRMANRAGNKARDYKSSLYRIYDSSENVNYYFVGELATPLLTMYESYYFGLTQMTKDQLYVERDAFYVALKAILSHVNNQECNNQFKLLFWRSDPEAGKTKVVNLHEFLLPIIKKELLEEETDTVVLSKIETDSADVDVDMVRRQPIDTFTGVHVTGSNPSGVYDDMLKLVKYSMDRDPRGRCIIINNNSFDKGQEPLTPRRGAQQDTKTMKDLFEQLHFQVEVHEDLTLPSLEKLLLTTSSADHSDYDAFVCVFMTHGKLGVLYTSDAKPVRILDIVDYFSDQQCPSLRGKPKMFFIQACQTGQGNPSNVQSTGAAAAAAATTSTTETDSAQIEDDANRVSTLFAALAVDVKTTETEIEEDANRAPTLFAAASVDVRTRATLVPSSPDFIMSYATLPGATAFRDTEIGSLYVNQLSENLSQRIEIDRALKLVTLGVAKSLEDQPDSSKVRRSQVPFHLVTGGKLLYL